MELRREHSSHAATVFLLLCLVIYSSFDQCDVPSSATPMSPSGNTSQPSLYEQQQIPPRYAPGLFLAACCVRAITSFVPLAIDGLYITRMYSLNWVAIGENLAGAFCQVRRDNVKGHCDRTLCQNNHKWGDKWRRVGMAQHHLDFNMLYRK